MHMIKVPGLILVLLYCELCLTIKVPVEWEERAISEVKNVSNDNLPVEIFQQQQNVQPIHSQNVQHTQFKHPIPNKYFEYTAQKPKFAADIAAFHGVKNPQQHFKAYPIKPYTGKQKPTLGLHQILKEDMRIYQPFQRFMHQNTDIKPTSSGYEIFHPYKAEEPALQEIYKDPILNKIRNDLENSKNRLQAYEQQAGEPNISKNEYLESPEKTDGKLSPYKNMPVQYEIHRPERRPVYYSVSPRDSHRDQILNKKLKHPWNQQSAKIRPMHYQPLHKQIHNLRQQHAMKYDDERNEYPQVQFPESIAEPIDGYDIYEKGKQKYTLLKNNLDESVNRVVLRSRPQKYQKLELQNQPKRHQKLDLKKNKPTDDDIEEEFVPIKNYAQVRKTETFKHVPKKAAFDDAETYEEILNAPRLREAVKSTKAQTVYSEEGYEDSAYDHAGEQKHASENERHGGFLKEYENSAGRYKIPIVNGKYHDSKGSDYQDKTEHGKKWKNDHKKDEAEVEDEDYSEVEQEESGDVNFYKNDGPETGNRNKRGGDSENEDATGDIDNGDISNKNSNNQSTIQNNKGNEMNAQHEVDKREANFRVPEIDLNSTFNIKTEIPKLSNLNVSQNEDDITVKYPYYFKNSEDIHKNSPLRYAENLKLIPKKSDGGTEFYDSRSKLECPEVDEEVNPLPENLKNGENPTEEVDDGDKEESKGQKSFETIKEQPRLKGLGDKIDCFKAKYFGENPLDSPFFKEEIISDPDPIIAPKLPIYILTNERQNGQESKTHNVIDTFEKLRETANTDLFDLLDKLKSDQSEIQETLNKTNEELRSSLYTPQSILATNDTQKLYVYTDVLKNIKKNNAVAPTYLLNINNNNATYNFIQNKNKETKSFPKLRKKRATPFVYEPYKIIRDSQVQDSKKTTTTNNISPLIKQLQSSRVADRVSRSNKDDKQVRPTTTIRTYIDIGRKERAKPSKHENDNSDATFVDVSIDHRRGEPRYELRPKNHKSEYTPVENKRSMSIEAYTSQTTSEKSRDISTKSPTRGRQPYRSITETTTPPYYDMSLFIPKVDDVQNVASSNAVKNTVTTSTPELNANHEQHQTKSADESGEYYDYEDDNDDEEQDNEEEEEIQFTTTTTTTTTPKPTIGRRIRIASTTEKMPEHTTATKPDHLRLVTRFRNYKPDENTEVKLTVTKSPDVNEHTEKGDINIPKYREMKKKTKTSTLVTDTKKYGDEDEYDIRKEIDSMIGGKQNMSEYMPSYEKENSQKDGQHQLTIDDEDNDDEDDTDEDDFDEDDDEDDDYHDEDDDEDEEGGKLKRNSKAKLTRIPTEPPTKRTLLKTTVATPTTVAAHIYTTAPTIPSRILKTDTKPVITKKKIEIHNELPVNKSSPNITQFRQDIKEIEIIREIPTVPKKKLDKKNEALELYKDDNLAKEINKLGDVEIFSESLDLDKGPKHGGNYRQATKEDSRLLKLPESVSKPPKDAETSQSENTKQVELDEYEVKQMHGGNLKSLSDLKRTRNDGKSSKLIELNDLPVKGMHGGNLKYNNRRRGDRKSEKLIELDDDHDHNDYKSNNARNDRRHGGNYRSAKSVDVKENNDDIQVKSITIDDRKNSAALLNSFAQAIPILTSTPGVILDPSKRMYYYVDA